ncbi:MAG: uroporphyrinogen-III C-methyltransferase [Gammaproteobacteria bacterium]|nr:uroporphyrinogen-III C-methyltransferase [Gammaproteobacteria bacterium]MDE0441829.1 uroporphyrinogen-III C-methyltransferase [Gammaproteobacteria bacterium]
MADSDSDPIKPEPSTDASRDAKSKAPTKPDPVEPEPPEQPAPTPSVPSATAPAKPRRTGRTLATFALLLSLVAIGGSVYLFYLAWLTDPDARFEAAIGAYQGDLANFHGATTEEVAALREEFAELREELAAQREALAEARTAMTEAIADNVASAPPAPREWRLAEVEYMLTIANHRLLLQDDAKGALGLLAASDRVLADLDDYRFHDVRALLAEEQLALKTVGYADMQGVFLRLEAVKQLLDRLPLRLPEYTSDDTDDTSTEAHQEASLLDAFLDRLGGLVRFRRHDGEAIRPLLAPQEAEYLEQHLRLALERAQLAVLRRDQEIFEISLRAARAWLHRFLDPSRTAVAQAMGELDELQSTNLEVRPPDISRSLGRLRQLRRNDDDAVPST